MRSAREPSTIGTLVFLMWGLIVWGLQFTALYLAHTWLCALDAPASATGILSGVLTVVAVVAILPVLVATARSGRVVGLWEDQPHLLMIARTVALLSTVAALWTGATVAFIDACALAR